MVAHVGDRLDLGHYLTIACGSGCSARTPVCASQNGCWWLFDDIDVFGPLLRDQALDELNKRNVSFKLNLNLWVCNQQLMTHMIDFLGHSLHFLLCEMCHRHR